MILTLTANPALDVTYRLAALEVGGVNRVLPSLAPGGKGVNVARVLARLGHTVTCTGFLGGEPGVRLRALLAESAVTQDWVEIDGETRSTINVLEESGVSTMLNEPGPAVTDAEWATLHERVSAMLNPSDVLVISGSMPPGTGARALTDLLADASARGAHTLVDTSGQSLLAAARAGVTLLKPNHHELLEATGARTVTEGARHLLDLGAGAVVVSCGADGVRVFGDRLDLRARPTQVLHGNPTGAGDAAVAALALALDGLESPPVGSLRTALAEALRGHLPDVVALSGAAVLSPVAGDVDLAAYARMRALITVEENHDAR